MKKQDIIPGKRIIFSGILIFSEIIFIYLLLDTLCEISYIIEIFMKLTSLTVAVVLLVNKNKSVYTALWIAFLLVLPAQSWMFYLFFNKRKNHKAETCNKVNVECCAGAPQNVNALIEYLSRNTGVVSCHNSYTRYYSCGEEFFSDYISELNCAKDYIYLEYFIFNKGKMWDSVHEILKNKAKEGVAVRIIFDDMCSLMFSGNKIAELRKEGITAVPFNRVRPFPDIKLNQRNHRKITVIDGVTAFTGGINISDEYINLKNRFGYWKDSALMIKGLAVREMTESFARTWNYCTGDSIVQGEKENSDYLESEGLVLPFDDAPVKTERISKMSYIKLINNSVDYVYLMTPYLIPDNDMITALCLAAECGVDVRIITPFIPDKKSVHLVTRAYYLPMLRSGVRIFEYVPGFIHSKTMVSDDVSAIAGTANIDYRSFYLLFENGVYMYRSQAVLQIKNDFINTLSLCREITTENYDEISYSERKIGEILKIISCIM